MVHGTCLSLCSSSFGSVFRLFGCGDQHWLFSCFVLLWYKQSILLIHLVAKGGIYLKFSCLEAGVCEESLGALFQSSR